MTTKLSGMGKLAEVIRENYDLGEVEMPTQLEAAHQRRHRKIVVKTSVGAFLAKTYANDPYVLDALRFQHRLSDHLLSNGLAVAEIQPARSGKRIIEVDNWALELQQFVSGEAMNVTPETLAVSADALGKLHAVCREFPRPERDARMWRFSEAPRDTFAKLFNMSLEGGDEKEMNGCCNTIALFLHGASRALSWEARDQFETGLIHGDWHGGNLLFQGNKLAAILDLEFAGDGCYLEDLSYAISNLCIRTTTEKDRLKRRTNVMLDNYQHHRRLSYAELVALYYAVGVKHVATVSYQIQQGKAVAGLGPQDWMRRLAAQCEWLGESARDIRGGVFRA